MRTFRGRSGAGVLATGVVAVAALGVLGVATPRAHAAPEDIAVEIVARTPSGESAELNLRFMDLDPPLPGFNIPIVNPLTGRTLAYLARIKASFYVGQRDMDFSIVAVGPETTDISISAVPFPLGYSVPFYAGSASAGVSVTDLDGDGASVTGLHPGGNAFLASYNADAGDGTTFLSGIPSVVASPDDSWTQSVGLPTTPIAGSVSDMRIQWNFRLSDNDFASGSSSYRIIPAPGGVLLAGFASGAQLIPRRRCRPRA